MACHHNVEGHCIVCAATAYKKANPRPVDVVSLHLQRNSGDSYCGQPFTDCLFSTLSAHDEDRFCRRCLIVYRKHQVMLKKRAWRAKPLRGHLDEAVRIFTNPGDFDTGILLVGAGCLLVFVVVPLIALWVRYDWESAALAAVGLALGIGLVRDGSSSRRH